MLTGETPADQLSHVLGAVRELLRKHPKIEQGTFSVRLKGFKHPSVQLELVAYVLETDQNSFDNVQEEMLRNIEGMIGQGGTGFAPAGQTAPRKNERIKGAGEKRPTSTEAGTKQ